MSDAERGAAAAVAVLAVILGLYAFRTWRSGGAWRQDLPALATSVALTLALVLVLLLSPPLVPFFGLPILLVILGILQIRQSRPPLGRSLGWLCIAAGLGLLFLNLLRLALFWTG